MKIGRVRSATMTLAGALLLCGSAGADAWRVPEHGAGADAWWVPGHFPTICLLYTSPSPRD